MREYNFQEDKERLEKALEEVRKSYQLKTENIQDLEQLSKTNEDFKKDQQKIYTDNVIDKMFFYIQNFNVPKRFSEAKLSDFGKKYDKTIIEGKSLYLMGQRGVGKTHLMAALLRDYLINTIEIRFWEDTRNNKKELKIVTDMFPWLDNEYRIKFISTPELLLEIRAAFKPNAETTEEQILEKYSLANILFLDDIGAEKTTDWSLQTLYLLIDRRYRDMLRTIISSNLTLDELAEKLDDRIASRIAGMCEIVEIKGKDRRISK